MKKNNISLFQNKFPGENLFFTSDTHFFHEGIIKFCNRPFASVEEMNEAMIRNWNEVVHEKGTVFHLGDFAFGGWREWTEDRTEPQPFPVLRRGIRRYLAAIWSCPFRTTEQNRQGHSAPKYAVPHTV